jgi:hypothetical protein
MIGRDEVITLESGTEISIEAARGDLARAIAYIEEVGDVDTIGLVADLHHVGELVELLGEVLEP